MKVSVRVPATTANLGPGFDCFGLALQIYNTITIEETIMPKEDIEIIIITHEDKEINELHLPTDNSNVIYRAIELLYGYVGQIPSAMKITIDTEIPIAKGLGSSASVIVGSLMAANKLLGSPADLDALLSIATEVEGHPDNITSAILGSFVLSSLEDDGSIIYQKIDWPQDWKLTLCIPDYELATNISRSVLPEEVKMQDAVFNARRCTMFIQSLQTKNSELMKIAMQDKLHQPYRIRLVPGLDEIIDNLKNVDEVLGTALSGAGPSILVISKGNNIETIKGIIKSTWEKYSVKADIRTVGVDLDGAKII